MLQLPLVDQADEEPTHGLRREEVDAPLRLPEAGKVDREHVSRRAQPRPQLLPGVEALGPRAQEQQRHLAVGIATRRIGSRRPSAFLVRVRRSPRSCDAQECVDVGGELLVVLEQKAVRRIRIDLDLASGMSPASRYE